MTNEQPAFTNRVQIIRRVLAINVRGLAVSNKGKLKTLNVKSELIAGVVKKKQLRSTDHGVRGSNCGEEKSEPGQRPSGAFLQRR